MKRTNPANIQVTKDFLDILNIFADILFLEINKNPPKSNVEFREQVDRAFSQVLFPADLATAKLKYNEPKLQFTKSGPVGTASYAAPIERQDYARRKPAKPYQVTPARQMQQTRMQQASSAWKSASPEIRIQWEQVAEKEQYLAVNLFCGIYMLLLADNQPIPNPFIPTPELLKYYHSRKSK
jgi:hypothetical protein